MDKIKALKNGLKVLIVLGVIIFFFELFVDSSKLHNKIALIVGVLIVTAFSFLFGLMVGQKWGD